MGDTISTPSSVFMSESHRVPSKVACAVEDTYWVKIYLSGPLEQIEQVCRRFCMIQGLCVTVEPTRFIYTGGEETGAVVGLVNYPRFPKEGREILETAQKLAFQLMVETYQQSVLVMSPTDSFWISARPEDNEKAN